MSLVDARFLLVRALGLVRRGWVSLSVRGWRASWQRVRVHAQSPSPASRPKLFQPSTGPFAPFSIPGSATPRVSVIVPVFNHFPHTLACLRAIAEHPPAIAFEVIVVDDGSSDETIESLPQINGVRYHRRVQNGGFIAACNDGAAQARGEILCFLNNDTVPQPGWLDALVATLDDDRDVGLVGAQLLYPDGRLQEAGGVVFADGSGWNYGRFESADDPRFSYARDADYLSGAAIAIPRALFEQVGGFDTLYAPAYYEDTDLAFAVRAAGRRVRYQPAARVVHDEGTTAGNDPGSGIKVFQSRNRERFAAHRREALTAQLPAGTVPSPALLHRRQRQILVIDALTPQPDHDSGSVRLVNLMQQLSEEGAHVVFLPANRAHAGQYTRQLQQLGIETWYAPYAQRAPAWLRTHGHRFDVVLLCRHYVASEFLQLLRQHAPQARIVFDTVDLHYLREQRAAELTGDNVLQRAAVRTRAAELAVIAASDITLVVSEVERALLALDAPLAKVEILSNLHRIAGPGLPYGERRDLVFVGGFRHPPNTDAVLWFAREVFPHVRARLPGVQFHCVGSDPPDAILALASEDAIHINGHVPDLAPYMHGGRIAVAPLRYGAGVKGKINLSMAHGQPVVATSCAVEGMHLLDGRDVLVADDAQQFADHVVRLYGDHSLWQQLAQGGLDNVARHFSLDSARDTIRGVFLT
jgi:GT2 family glycosyltransferase